MRPASLFLSFLSLCAVRGQYASTYPAPIPLFHKSPYLNGYIYADADITNTPESKWPRFFSGPDLGWLVGLRVDGKPYLFQGDHGNYTSAKTNNVYLTPTRTIFTIDAGPVRVNITYLTPIEMLDWTRHSLPFIYLAVDLWSTDGASHNLQFYTDVAGQFVSSNAANKIMWNSVQTNRLVYHVMNQTNFQPLTENSDMSEDGSQYFAYKSIPGVSLTWQIASAKIRIDFITAGNLTNTTDTKFRAINDDWAVSAFALDFGNITRTTTPLVFAMGLVRDPVVTYQTVSQLEPRSQLWRKRWSDVESAVDDFLSGFSDAFSRAVAFDNSIISATSAISSKFMSTTPSSATNLADLVILSLRQTVGSLEFTASQLSNQGMDDLRVFMKDVGTSRRVNPVEVIYASFPAFLYLNATLAGRLLEPLLEFQSSALYSQVYAASDLGGSWPNVLGNNTDSSFAIDSCGAMLIMALAHARKSGDGTLLLTYYDLLRKWADFLVTKSLQPTGFATADGLLSATSNLELKGIMGIYAMGQINQILEGRGVDSSLTSHYLDTARNFAQQWQNSVLTSDHVLSSYGTNASWGLLYNLYAPRLLGADIIPEQIYTLQAGWYYSQSTKAQSIQPYGLPYESSQAVIVKAHWTLLTAGSVFNSTSSNARDALLSMVHARSFMKTGQKANPSTYSAIDGSLTTGTASPAMGAAFALLALDLPDLTTTLPSGAVKSSTRASTNQVPAIVGGVVGSLAGIGFVIFLAFLYVRRRHRKTKPLNIDDDDDDDVPEAIPTGPSLITPFMSESDRNERGGSEDVGVPSLASSPVRHPEKLLPNRPREYSHTRISSNNIDPGSITESNSSVTGSRNAKASMSPQDGDLRREVEQLRMVVETLRDQQVPQPQVVYQDLRDVPDEPPPGYGPPG